MCSTKTSSNKAKVNHMAVIIPTMLCGECGFVLFSVPHRDSVGRDFVCTNQRCGYNGVWYTPSGFSLTVPLEPVYDYQG